MPTRILELFGYPAADPSEQASLARRDESCPFITGRCRKQLSDGTVSGVCTLQTLRGSPVVCCPIRLYADSYRCLKSVAQRAFGENLPFVAPSAALERESIVAFGKDWGQELRLPQRGGRGSFSVDWVLARVSRNRDLLEFVAVEVQAIDTTGNYRAERSALLGGARDPAPSTAGFNWENVNKRILPQLIYKGHVLRQEPLCQKGLFFVCPEPVYERVITRLGGGLRPYAMQPGALTFVWYQLGDAPAPGLVRGLHEVGHFTTTIDQVALAFTAPSNLPPSRVYEHAIRAALGQP